MERVVITGLGISCSVGKNVPEFREALEHGKAGHKAIKSDRFSVESKVYRTKEACVLDQEHYNELAEKDETILAELSQQIISEAMKDANLTKEDFEGKRVGLCMATSVGGSYPFMKWLKGTLEGEVMDSGLLFATTPTITGKIAKQFGLRGPLSTVSTACASGTNSIGRAFDFVSKGRAPMMIAGGVDVFTELTFSGFNSLMALSKSNCKPFDKKRDGLNLGDGGGFVIVESLESAKARNAKIYAEIKGYSILNEAYHATAPKPDGSFALMAINNALKQGDIQPEEVDYVNAHGTGTAANDSMEIKAIRQVGGDKKIYVSSTKSMVGHTLGAAGSVELVATALAMKEGFIPPSIGVDDSLIEEEDNIILVQGKALKKEIKVAVSNSFGFAGNMASIVLQRYN